MLAMAVLESSRGTEQRASGRHGSVSGNTLERLYLPYNTGLSLETSLLVIILPSMFTGFTRILALSSANDSLTPSESLSTTTSLRKLRVSNPDKRFMTFR